MNCSCRTKRALQGVSRTLPPHCDPAPCSFRLNNIRSWSACRSRDWLHTGEDVVHADNAETSIMGILIRRIASRKYVRYTLSGASLAVDSCLIHCCTRPTASKHRNMPIKTDICYRGDTTRLLHDHQGSKRFRVSRKSTVVTVSYAGCRQGPWCLTSQHTSAMLTQQQ